MSPFGGTRPGSLSTAGIAVFLAVAVCLTIPSLAGTTPRQQAVESKGTYIVVLAPDVDAEAVAEEHAAAYGIEVIYLFGSALNGYAARIPLERLAELQLDPRVLSIEEDQPVRVAS